MIVLLLVVVLQEVVVLVVVVVVRELLVVVVEVVLEEVVELLRQHDRELKHEHDNTCALLLTWAKMATEWVQSGRLYEIHGIRMYVFDCLFLFVCADIESKNYTLNQFQYTVHYGNI